jgi:hypothetical protein
MNLTQHTFAFSISCQQNRVMRDHGHPAAVAQLVEQRTFNPKVVGSNPTGGITKWLEAAVFAEIC